MKLAKNGKILIPDYFLMETEVELATFLVCEDCVSCFWGVYFREMYSKWTIVAYFGQYLMKKAEF